MLRFLEAKCVYRGLVLTALLFTVCPWGVGQATRRIALVEANGPLARSNGVFTAIEIRVTDETSGKLAGTPGITLVDRASVDRILKEQNFQNSDRSSPETAARIGKLLGIGQIVMVNVYDANWSTHDERQGSTVRTTGTMVLRANARVIDVETGEILAQPASSFQETVPVSETSTSQGFVIGGIRVPPKQKSGGGDPKVIQDNEFAKASDTVTKELSTKLITAMAGLRGPKMPAALVAGIANGSVYINKGAAAGVKPGDKFQVIRETATGLTDPETGKPITDKQRVCVLTIVKTMDTNASGSCQGGLPQSKDVAEPMNP